MSHKRRNRAKCKICKEIIESKFRHHFVGCTCYQNSGGSNGIFVDGGHDYFRRGGDLKNLEEVFET